MKKILYALIAIPLFIIWPLSFLICTECMYSDKMNPLLVFILSSLIYFVIIIMPLNYFFDKFSKKEK
jgi:hypothetical protein